MLEFETGLRGGNALLGIEMKTDQVRKEEHRQRFGRVEARRFGIDRAERAEELTVRRVNRDRDVALKPVA